MTKFGLGWCPYCRHSCQLRGDGKIRKHRQPKLSPADIKRCHDHICQGTGQDPYTYPEDEDTPHARSEMAGQTEIEL